MIAAPLAEWCINGICDATREMVGGGELNFIRSGRHARAIILAVVASAEIDSKIVFESFPCQLRLLLSVYYWRCEVAIQTDDTRASIPQTSGATNCLRANIIQPLMSIITQICYGGRSPATAPISQFCVNTAAGSPRVLLWTWHRLCISGALLEMKPSRHRVKNASALILLGGFWNMTLVLGGNVRRIPASRGVKLVSQHQHLTNSPFLQ